jgi:hypothetical protein
VIQGILIALIAIILFLLWITLYVSEISDEISEIRKLLSSKFVAKKSKGSKNIGNSQYDVKKDPKCKRVNKRKKGSDYDSAED